MKPNVLTMRPPCFHKVFVHIEKKTQNICITNILLTVLCHYRKTTPKAVNFSEVTSFLSSLSSWDTSKGCLSVLRQPVVGENETHGHPGAVVPWSM